MKSLSTLCGVLVAFFLSFQAIAQTPQGINYQTVIHDTGGNIVANQNIGFQLAIYKLATPTERYEETQSAMTNS
ncbi:hypothetical protein ACFQ1M_01585 [Sungkyunkwania multivorans]|uniref:Uncharacterized protein n=1 Tax=Sungkyunkwania multivorans TaxID=1173618 RepID=A0ABW3CSZ2_9FLAO